jgi:hypothetical protein
MSTLHVMMSTVASGDDAELHAGVSHRGSGHRVIAALADECVNLPPAAVLPDCAMTSFDTGAVPRVLCLPGAAAHSVTA